ncbi:hypothetical protein HanRHA438_Chr08g0339441 [Helianthus annuus]|nr:hypothetical protein HanRHA438_Chr08g0339441 [Helianthus annuus]
MFDNAAIIPLAEVSFWILNATFSNRESVITALAFLSILSQSACGIFSGFSSLSTKSKSF